MKFPPFVSRCLAIGIYGLGPMPGTRIGSLQAIGDIFGATDFFNFIAELKGKCQVIGKSQ